LQQQVHRGERGLARATVPLGTRGEYALLKRKDGSENLFTILSVRILVGSVWKGLWDRVAESDQRALNASDGVNIIRRGRRFDRRRPDSGPLKTSIANSAFKNVGIESPRSGEI
jgi:hypothetical protein